MTVYKMMEIHGKRHEDANDMSTIKGTSAETFLSTSAERTIYFF